MYLAGGDEVRDDLRSIIEEAAGEDELLLRGGGAARIASLQLVLEIAYSPRVRQFDREIRLSRILHHQTNHCSTSLLFFLLMCLSYATSRLHAALLPEEGVTSPDQ